MRPLVSVILPSYNHAAFVGAAIRSVLDQAYGGEVEVLVTDDGSHDGTPDIVRAISDKRVSLEILPENRGASIAANSSIRRARGEFICTLASDDFFLPDKIEKQVAFLEAKPDVAAVFGMPKLIDERGLPLPPEGGFPGVNFRTPLLEGLGPRRQWLRYFFVHGNCLCQPTAMLRRAALERIGCFDPRLASLPDFDLWVRLCMEHDIHVMPDELTALRIRDSSLNQSAPRRDSILRSFIEHFEILKHYRRLPRETVLEIFGVDLAEHDARMDASGDVLLVQVALLLGSNPAHQLFALDTMFNRAAPSDGDYRLLHDLSGAVDVFGTGARDEADALRKRVAGSEAEIARLARDLAQARAEIARLREARP